MSQDGAIARAGVLKEYLLEAGIKTVSIELVVGRPGGPNGGWWTDTFVGTLGHHIVSRRSQGLTPFLSLVKTGRVDLPGPICNGYGGFDEVARIICMGWANHPGQGGPQTVELGTIPENNGRPYLFGWEFEGGVSEDDWPPSMRDFMGRCHAGTLNYLADIHDQALTEASHLEHKTWATPPGRKVDRLGYTLTEARDEAGRFIGEEMPEGYLPLYQNDGTADQRPHKASDVAWLQARLNRAFGTALLSDGKYGPATAAVIAQYLPDANADAGGTPGRAFTGNRADDLDWALAVRAASSIGGSVPTHSHELPSHTHDGRYVRKNVGVKITDT